MKRLSVLFFMSLWTVILLAGCDAIPGMGSEPVPVAQPAPPPVAPIPGQLPVAPIPGQPVAAPIPGQPVAPVPVAPIPGQPVAVPPATPIPGQPVAAPIPGQPVAGAMTPPTPTGDALADKLNLKKFQIAAAFIPTSAMVKHTLKKGKTQDYQVSLPGPPYCHTFIATAADAVGNLNVAVESPAGTVDATDTTQDTSPVIFNHCPVAPGLYKVKVSMPKKGGEFALQAFSK